MSMILGRIFEFREFQLDLGARTLRREKATVSLNSRAFDVLVFFVQNPGKILTREEVLKNVWAEAVDENTLVQSISLLRRALDEKPGDNNYIVTVPGRGYQFVAPVQVVTPEIVAAENGNAVREPAVHARSDSRGLVFQRHTIQTSVVTTEEERKQPGPAISRGRVAKSITAAAIASALVASVAFAGYRRTHSIPKLAEKDSIVVADFDNRTGDPLFDDTLKQALTVSLDQSPYLNVVSDQKIDDALKLMGRDTGQRITGKMARDLCQRVRGNALLQGSIASFGSQYLVVLTVTNCATGDSLASEQARAESKEKILPELGKAASSLRNKLGESVGSIEKYDTPMEQASTPSLAALQAYSAGLKAWRTQGNAAAVPFYKRAIELDPNFAVAYAHLGQAYDNLGQGNASIENCKKAFSLRDRVSERERFYIDSRYYEIVTGEQEKEVQVLEQWRQLYPREPSPAYALAWKYRYLGRYGDALRQAREAVRLEPDFDANNEALVFTAISLNHLDEAQTALEALQSREPPAYWQEGLYVLAFLRGDSAGTQKLASSTASKDNNLDSGDFLSLQSNTEAYFGRLQKARELTRHAVEAEVGGGPEGANWRVALFKFNGAFREVLFGYPAQAQRDAIAALAPDKTGTGSQYLAALVLALAGDAARAETITADWAKKGPRDSVVNMYGVATIRAAIQLSHNNPASAVRDLEVTSRYDLAVNVAPPLLPVYVRGQAFLAMHQGREAAAEFQKFIDYRGAVGNNPIGAVARVGLARAYVMEGDTTKARAAYQEFFSMWKEADSEIPILKEAQAEYARLQ